MTPSPPKSSPSPSLTLRFILLGLSILVALLLIEGAVRVRQWMRYGTAGAEAVSLVTDPASGLRCARPNMDNGRIRTDSHGFRNPEIQVPKPPERLRLAFLGGSTTFCSEVTNNEATWPYLVTKELKARYPDVSFDYVNAAEVGYGLESSLKNLRVRVAPLTPDFLLYYEATNDFSMDTRKLARQEGIYNEDPDRPSPLARISTAWGLVEKNLTLRRRAAMTGPRLVYNADSLARGFESRLVEFLATSRQLGALTAVATFSPKVRRDQPPAVQQKACVSSLYYCPYMSVAGLLDGWDAYNRAIREAAHATGSILIEGENDIPGDDVHYADSVHFLDAGAKAMADRVAQALIASPEFNRLVASKRGPDAANP